MCRGARLGSGVVYRLAYKRAGEIDLGVGLHCSFPPFPERYMNRDLQAVVKLEAQKGGDTSIAHATASYKDTIGWTFVLKNCQTQKSHSDQESPLLSDARNAHERCHRSSISDMYVVIDKNDDSQGTDRICR
jgi:hypothetical protein